MSTVPARTTPAPTAAATPAPAATTVLTDLVAFTAFASECEEGKIATEHSLRWWLRYRHENGLSACGAVVERRPNPRSTRPQLFINRPRFVAWLSGGA